MKKCGYKTHFTSGILWDTSQSKKNIKEEKPIHSEVECVDFWNECDINYEFN